MTLVDFSVFSALFRRTPNDIQADTLSAIPAAKAARIAGRFVILRVHIGELGHVKATSIKISCGQPHIDLRAATELSNTVFPVPRVGRKAVAQWHVMRWEVPLELRR